MALRGERFFVPLDEDDDKNVSEASAPSAFDFIADVRERETVAPKPPTAPTLKSTTTGFPAHKKRVSAFKQQRAHQSGAQHVPSAPIPAPVRAAPVPTPEPQAGGRQDFEAAERRRIDEENSQKLATMSAEDIERERQELMAGLNPAFMEMLLKRANIDSTEGEGGDFPAASETTEAVEKPKSTKKVTFDTTPAAEPERKSLNGEAKPMSARLPSVLDQDPKTSPQQQQRLPPVDNDDLEFPLATELPPQGTVHFPTAPQPPPLDPSSPNFLNDLHEKYFPELPVETSKLSWLDSSATTALDTYSPSLPSISPSNLRFSFKGALIPPQTANEIPVTKGLHHHGLDPSSAGYTISELAILARSTVAAQRCIAFQTLGRILFRLGKGEFGNADLIRTRPDVDWNLVEEGTEEGEEGQEMAMARLARGLWNCVKEEKVVEILEMEVNRLAGHVSAKAYATEALWLWRRGGGAYERAV